ncbi:restriction endonuclease subunit S [Nitrosomonas ureae]|uniref:Type I restriction enzyme, S subunit n=1 Tax=Nitrosomonas ureae TaxID=44577 RepID=A0A1H5S778_9PROT|nr:restriction endonuclease subunit S [Nitrosomonas ureae]SEF46459.1 type I restriction enzyme, S subunit [Nitrosomonas ureae]
MSEWHEISLGNLVDTVVDNRGKTPPISKIGHELLEVNAISHGNRTPDYSKIRKFVSEETYRNWFRKGHPQPGDILVPTGNVALVEERRGTIAQNLIALRLKIGVDSRYVYYFLSSPLGKDLMLSLDIGGVQPSIKVPHLLDMTIPIPPLAEQKAIASVLSSLDDKIDLLHCQNKTLEAMAETLFRQWFVEEAQEDWKEVTIGDFVELNRASIDKNYPYQAIEYLDTGSLTEGKIESFQSFALDDAPSRAKRLVQHNDVLISTVRPDQKHYGIIKNPIENLVVSTGFCVLTCKKIDPHFIYLLLTNDEMTDYLHTIAEGSTSTYPSLKPSDIGSIVFQLPPCGKLEEFSFITQSSWEKIEKNHIQIRTLETLRDTLLSKLMSGEVRVDYA